MRYTHSTHMSFKNVLFLTHIQHTFNLRFFFSSGLVLYVCKYSVNYIFVL